MNFKDEKFYSLDLFDSGELIYEAEKHKWFKDSFEKQYVALNQKIESIKKNLLLMVFGLMSVICIIGWRGVKRHRKNRKRLRRVKGR